MGHVAVWVAEEVEGVTSEYLEGARLADEEMAKGCVVANDRDIDLSVCDVQRVVRGELEVLGLHPQDRLRVFPYGLVYETLEPARGRRDEAREEDGEHEPNRGKGASDSR